MEGFDLNALRGQAAERAESVPSQSQEGSAMEERITELEARIVAGFSEEERAQFTQEYDTTPEKFLENLKMLATLRGGNAESGNID